MSHHDLQFPPVLQQWVEAQISLGNYADVGDYLRDLVRRDQREARDERLWLRAEIETGLASGLVDGEAEEVLDRIMAEDPDLRD